MVSRSGLGLYSPKILPFSRVFSALFLPQGLVLPLLWAFRHTFGSLAPSPTHTPYLLSHTYLYTPMPPDTPLRHACDSSGLHAAPPPSGQAANTPPPPSRQPPPPASFDR